MRRVLAMVGMTLGGWIGWEIGSVVSLFTAFIVGMLGTAVGLYLTNRYVAAYLP